MTTQRLYRASDYDTWADCAAFAETVETAQAYLDNPGFGGASLWSTDIEVDAATVLDAREMSAADVANLIDHPDPGAIGTDEYVPRVCSELQDAGFHWVLVAESYPADTTTWTWVGPSDCEPELEPAL